MLRVCGGRPDLLVRLGAAPGRERAGLRRLSPQPWPATRLTTALRRLRGRHGLCSIGGLPGLGMLMRLLMWWLLRVLLLRLPGLPGLGG
ncbi:hypothetical protein ACU635_00365 [[Actinomadura] parvosata]|uniref:hypothetical protein n=1 Tax=[Actinomadura] parvosata TaxID=1955412 RepID=UPI00406CA636